MQSIQYSIPKQECPSQRISDKVGMDIQTVCWLQTNEQAREQCQNFQTVRQSVSPSPTQKKQTTFITRTSQIKWIFKLYLS